MKLITGCTLYAALIVCFLLGIVAAKTKEGFCPPLNPAAKCPQTLPASTCAADQNCTGNQKCCPNDCYGVGTGYQCRSPVKKGGCPASVACAASTSKTCGSDNDCDSLWKCCPSDCNQPRCANPVMVKAGSCPSRPDANSILDDSLCKRTCTDDYDCLGPKKCCFNGCGFQCA